MYNSPLVFFHSSALYWLPLLALALDLAVADPRRLPHPVQFIGFLAGKMEAFCRRWFSPLVGGAIAAVLVVLHVWVGARLLLRLPLLGGLVALYLCWAGLALGTLLREGRAALALVESGSLDEARSSVQMLVTRDTSAMDRDGLRRSLAETLSENLNDGVIAPFFWLLLTGPAGLWAYKAVSTLDSMWGYKTERWLYFGKTAALADDVLAWIPARLTALFLYLSGLVMHLNMHRGISQNTRLSPTWSGWGKVMSDARQMASPNAGWPMATAAWLHGASMGGPTAYHGEVVDKPRLGPADQPWSTASLERLIRHIRLAGILGALGMWATMVVLRLFFI